MSLPYVAVLEKAQRCNLCRTRFRPAACRWATTSSPALLTRPARSWAPRETEGITKTAQTTPLVKRHSLMVTGDFPPVAVGPGEIASRTLLLTAN